MKKLLLLAIGGLIYVSCNNSADDKAESNIKNYIAENTVNSESYKVVETKVDSIYAPMESPELYKLFDKYVMAANKLRDHQEMITEMQTKMGKFTDMYSDSLITKLNPIIKSLEDYVAIMENMERMMNAESKFIGYKAVQTYTMEENGKDVKHTDVFMFNNDLSSVLHQMRKEDYIFVSEHLKKMKQNIHSQIEANRSTIEIAKKLTE